MEITTYRVKNEDGSYSVVVGFKGSEQEVKDAMERVEEIAHNVIGKKSNITILEGEI